MLKEWKEKRELQRYLARKETENPSSRFEGKNRSLLDKILMNRERKKIEKEKEEQKQREVVNEYKSSFGRDPFYLEREKNKQMELKRGFVKTKDLGQSAKDVKVVPNIYGWPQIKGENLDELYEKKKDFWKKRNYNWDSSEEIKNKLDDIREKRIDGERAKMFSELEKEIETGEFNAGHFDKFTHSNMLYNSDLEKRGKRGIPEEELNTKVEEKYLEKFPFVDLKKVISENPGLYFVHTIPLGRNPNNFVDRKKGESWEDLVDYLVKEKPSISASSIKEGAITRDIYPNTGIGVLLKGGKIASAHEGDIGSRGYSKHLRLTGALFGNPNKYLKEAINSKRGYNEIVVNNPEVGGLFLLEDPHYSISFEGDRDLRRKISGKAEELGVPFYVFRPGEGMKPYVSEEESRKHLEKGELIIPDEVVDFLIVVGFLGFFISLIYGFFNIKSVGFVMGEFQNTSILVGSIFFVSLFFLCFGFWFRRKRNKKIRLKQENSLDNLKKISKR